MKEANVVDVNYFGKEHWADVYHAFPIIAQLNLFGFQLTDRLGNLVYWIKTNENKCRPNMFCCAQRANFY